jgi:hypothetical protein
MTEVMQAWQMEALTLTVSLKLEAMLTLLQMISYLRKVIDSLVSSGRLHG